MDAINKYLSPLTDIGADIWNAEETPDFPLPLKKKEAIPDGDDNMDAYSPAEEEESNDDSASSAQSEAIEQEETQTPDEQEECEEASRESLPQEDFEPQAPVAISEGGESVTVEEIKEVASEKDAVIVDRAVDAAIENIVEKQPEPPEESMQTASRLESSSEEVTSDQSSSASFISTLRIVSRNDDTPTSEQVNGTAISDTEAEVTSALTQADNYGAEKDPLFVAHVVAPLAKTIGSLAYRYHLTLSLETEERELRALLARVQAMASSINMIFKQSGVTAIGLTPRFMYVSRPVVQQAYELYHAPLSDVYFMRLQAIIENLAHFSLRLFPQNWHVGELDAHDRLDVFEALSPVVVALGQSADEKTETLAKDVCQTLLGKVQAWSARTEKGVYSDNARMLSRFSSLFADIYLTEVERFSNLEPQEKHIYLNTYNQAPSLPIIWDLFDKKVEMLKKISDSVDNSAASCD